VHARIAATVYQLQSPQQFRLIAQLQFDFSHFFWCQSFVQIGLEFRLCELASTHGRS
jgi:hypothetical protein